MANRVIGVNENGRRVGEDHPRAKLTDNEVDLMRELYEEGTWTLTSLADKFEVTLQCVKLICTYKRRTSTAVNYRSINTEHDEVVLVRESEA